MNKKAKNTISLLDSPNLYVLRSRMVNGLGQTS
jgi:hypothetical protein